MAKKTQNTNNAKHNVVEFFEQSFFLKELFKNTTDIFFILNKDLKFIYVNATAQVKFGLKDDFDKIKNYIDPSNLNFLFKNIQLTNPDFVGILNFKTNTGEKIYTDYRISAFGQIESTVYYILCKNVTEQVLAKKELKIQNDKIKAIFESGTQHIFSFNRDLIFTEFNINTRADSWYYYNYALEKDVTNLLDWIALMSPENVNLVNEQAQKTLTGKSTEFEFEILLNGERYYREVYFYPIYDDESIVVQVSCISHNITKRKRADLKIISQQAKLAAVFESGNNHIFSINSDSKILSYNNNFSGFVLKEIEVDIKDRHIKLFDIYTDNDEILREHIRIAFKGIPQFYEYHYIKNYKHQIFELYLNPIMENKSQIEEVSVLAINTTENFYNREKLFTQNAKLDAILNNANYAFVSFDISFQITSFNNQFKFLYQSVNKKTPYIGMSLKDRFIDVLGLKQEDILNALQIFSKSQKDLPVGKSIEYKVVNAIGESVWYDIYYSFITNKYNSFVECSLLLQNINDKKIAEVQQKESLLEKEILLKEIHHRVKNNLQVISSILNLQSGFVKDKNTLEVLRESQNRIKSMSFIHEILYQSNEFTSIPFNNYVHNIVRNLVDSYRIPNQQVNVNVNISDFEIDLDTSIPCGLIINELVSNAFKHAFKNRKVGNLEIICEENNDAITLKVIDDGNGMPDNFDIKTSQSLGLQLVLALVEQIDATLEIINDNGTAFLITFTFRTVKKQ